MEYGVRMTQPPAASDVVTAVEYQLQSIDPTSTPHGGEGTWFRYVIAQGSNLITGLHAGNEAQVDSAVREMVERLNERRTGKTRPRIKSPAK